MYPKVFCVLPIVLTAACNSLPTQQGALPPVSDARTIIRSGGRDIQFDYPFTFEDGTSIHLHETQEGNLIYCLWLQEAEICRVSTERFVEVFGISMETLCGGTKFARVFEFVQDTDPRIRFFYLDGYVTSDPDEALRFISDDPNCWPGLITRLD